VRLGIMTSGGFWTSEGRVLNLVTYLVKYDILPDKAQTYFKWTDSTIRRVMAVPGVVELRAYRPAAGAPQIVVTYEFADLAAWAAWYAHEDLQKVTDELRTFTTNVSSELWGPSPVDREPIRAEKEARQLRLEEIKGRRHSCFRYRSSARYTSTLGFPSSFAVVRPPEVENLSVYSHWSGSKTAVHC